MEPVRDRISGTARRGGASDARPAWRAAGLGNRALGALLARSTGEPGERRAIARALAQRAAAPSGAGQPLARAQARALARAIAGRAPAELVQRAAPWTTEDLHREIYGDPSLAHQGVPPISSEPEPASVPSPDAEGTAEYGPAPLPPIQLFPPRLFPPLVPEPPSLLGPRVPPPLPQSRGEWLEEALKRDKLLKALPDWAREKAIKGLKDADEMAAEKIIGALPLEDAYKKALNAAVKALLQTAKGKKFKEPTPPPPGRDPSWETPPSFPKAPGQVIIPLFERKF